MYFEYNDEKSIANKQKHGIDFVEAQVIWRDENRVEIAAKNIDEQRHLIIGVVDEKHWSAVVTYRDNNIRLISVRRSRIEEVKIYENI